MKRSRPHKPRNCYRDKTWLAAVHRAWRQRANLPDLDAQFVTALREEPVPNYITCELTILGRRRPLKLPRFGPTNVTAAVEQLRAWKEQDLISDAVAVQAARCLALIEQAAS